jgi:hypothetical protein
MKRNPEENQGFSLLARNLQLEDGATKPGEEGESNFLLGEDAGKSKSNWKGC